MEESWVAISVLDDIPLEWVNIWEDENETIVSGKWLTDTQEDNRILRLGFAIDIGENWADEELDRARRSRVVDEKLRDFRDQRALQAVLDAEEGDIREDEERESEDEVAEDSPNGEGISWLPAHIQQLGNDDENGDEEANERLEMIIRTL